MTHVVVIGIVTNNRRQTVMCLSQPKQLLARCRLKEVTNKLALAVVIMVVIDIIIVIMVVVIPVG